MMRNNDVFIESISNLLHSARLFFENSSHILGDLYNRQNSSANACSELSCNKMPLSMEEWIAYTFEVARKQAIAYHKIRLWQTAKAKQKAPNASGLFTYL